VVTIAIIYKYIMKNICEKKLRTFLIVFSIMMSSALFFASSAISGTIENMYIKRMKQVYGSADIIILPDSKSPSNFFRTTSAKIYEDKFDYIIGAIQTSALYSPSKNENFNFTIIGMDYNEMQKISPFFEHESIDEPFEGRKIIISSSMAKKYNLTLNQTIDLNIQGSKQKFRIHSIADSGIFTYNTMYGYALVPRDCIASILDALGKSNIIYLKVSDGIQINEAIKLLSNEYKQYTVKEPFNTKGIKEQTASLTTTLLIMSIIVFIMSIFIIYSSFKVITLERLPIIGTFRSIGASITTTILVLIVETLFYGAIGGLLGCVFGIAILYVLAYFSVSSVSIGIQIYFSPSMLIVAFFVALLTAFISAIFPIIRISKIPIKDIILNSIQPKSKKSFLRLIIAMSMLLISIIIPIIIPHELRTVFLPILVLCMVFSIISIVIFIPYATNIILRFFEKAYFLVFGNEGILAVKNLRNNSSIINNISLLAIGISSLLMINIISVSVEIEVLNIYNKLNYEILLTSTTSSRQFDSVLLSVEGVNSYTKACSVRNVQVTNKNENIMVVSGIDIYNYNDYFDLYFEDDCLSTLENGRNIIVTKFLKESMGISKGDILELALSEGIRQYRVTGFFDTYLNNGSIALVSERFFKMDTLNNHYYEYYIKTNAPPHEVEKNILSKFSKSKVSLITMDDLIEQNNQSNNDLFTILKGFSLLALLAGIFGVLNNYLISFIERKRTLAVLRSAGMEKRQTIKMLFIESLTGGIIGGIAGITAGLLLLFNISYVIKAMKLPIVLHYSFTLFLYSILGGIFITLVASISPAIKSSKLSIIEAIKFE